MSYYEKNAEEKGYYHFKHRKIWYSEAHFHGAVEFIFIENGFLDAVVDGEKITLTAGQGLFVDSFSVHSYSEKSENSGYVLLGDKQVFNKYFGILGGVPPRIFSFDDFELLSNLYGYCAKKFKDDGTKASVFEGVVGVILGNICEKTGVTERKKTGSVLVTDILSYAEQNYAQDISLSFMAKHFGYSKEHLSRLLHKYLSENWNSYIGRLRAKRVNELLSSNPKESVLTLAMDCGFDSSNTFYRAYKKAFGKYPKVR